MTGKRTIRLHRSEKGGRKNWLPNFGFGRRPPFPPGEAGALVIFKEDKMYNSECRERCPNRKSIYREISTGQSNQKEIIIERYECKISPYYGTRFDSTCSPEDIPNCPCKQE